MALIDKLTAIANGFRSSRGTTDKLSLDEMATLAAEPISGVNKLPQVVDETITELTAEDLDGATKIRNSMFKGYAGLASVIIPDSVKDIGTEAFYYCSSLTSVTIGGGVTSIGKTAFSYCSSLPGITIPDNVKRINNDAFSYCNNLTSVTIGNGVTYIGASAFQSCGKLTNVKIGNSVKTISQRAFASCNILTRITIPASVESIESISLAIGSPSDVYRATITFLGTTPPTMSAAAFKIDYLNKIIVPVGCGEAYKTATNWANFADFIEEAAE